MADRIDRRLVLVGGELAQEALLMVTVVALPPLPVLLSLLLAKATVVTIAPSPGPPPPPCRRWSNDDREAGRDF